MKWLMIVCISFISCGQKNAETETSGGDTATQPAQADDTTITQVPPATSQLIVPGESIGNISIGTDATDLETLLGKPDASDAAMGKAWLTWNGKRDEHNNVTSLNIYTTYKDSSMRQKTVQQIRTTSSSFSTVEDLHVYASLETIKDKFSAIKKRAHYTDEGTDIIIFDEQQKGIAFEIVAASGQQICTGIIVHKKGEAVTNVYRFLHPDMKFFE
jgi:hypothetical protein